MKIIHQSGYTRDELALYRLTVHRNVIDCAKALIGGMRQFDIEPENQDNKANIEYLLEYELGADPSAELDSKFAEAITSLWKDPCMPRVLDRSNEFYLMDSAP